MMCAWNELTSILPQWLQAKLRPYEKEILQEIRLRINAPPELLAANKTIWLSGSVTIRDLQFCINAASKYSPWAASTIAQGYITAPGGHRIGICGEAVVQNGIFTGIRTAHSLCIRIARDFDGIAVQAWKPNRSIMILGTPGSGKTTLLRDLSRIASKAHTVAVVDERQELFPEHFQCGRKMDILSGCPKQQGIDMVLRTMGPEYIAVDEITASDDCKAVIRASFCGVLFLVTAHAHDLDDFYRRTVYKELAESRIFGTFLIVRRDKSFIVEDVY